MISDRIVAMVDVSSPTSSHPKIIIEIGKY